MMKAEYEEYMQITPCKLCKGQRLKQSSLAVKVGEKNIYEVTELSVKKLVDYFETPAGDFYRFEVYLNGGKAEVDVTEDGKVSVAGYGY